MLYNIINEIHYIRQKVTQHSWWLSIVSISNTTVPGLEIFPQKYRTGMINANHSQTGCSSLGPGTNIRAELGLEFQALPLNLDIL